MPPSTLRRQLATLVDAGLIVRRDSPNGKRYARNGRGGEITFAFGFDLAPLVTRAEEFERLAEEIAAEARAVRLGKERITFCRCDIAKMIATGIEEGVPTRRAGEGPASWLEVHMSFRGLVEGISRPARLDELEAAADALSSLADDILNLLETQVKITNMCANESQTSQLNLNLAFKKAGRRGQSQILNQPWSRTEPIRLEWFFLPARTLSTTPRGGRKLARFSRNSVGRPADAWNQSERLRGRAIRHGRDAGRNHCCLPIAAKLRDSVSWRIFARTDPKSGGRGIFIRADSHGPNQCTDQRK